MTIKGELMKYLTRQMSPSIFFDAVGRDDYEAGGPCPSPGILINAPPEDGRCNICERSIDELKPYGGPGDPLVGDFTGAKLVKQFREIFPGQVAASWECRDCFCQLGPLWAFDFEKENGRPMTEEEMAEYVKSCLEYMESC